MYAELGAAADKAVDFYVAAHMFYVLLDDPKTKASAADVFGMFVLHPVKPLKKTFSFFGGYAGTGIADFCCQFVFFYLV